MTLRATRTNLAMTSVIRRGTLVALLSAGAVHAAESPTPAALRNSEVGVAFQSIDAGGNKNNSAALFGQMVFPLASAFGASIDGSYGHTNLLLERVSNPTGKVSCGYDTTAASAGLFARVATIGKLEARYGASRISSKCDDNASFLGDGSSTLDSDGYTIGAEYYFNALTLGASRSETTLDAGGSYTTDAVRATWYPVADLSVTPLAGRSRGADFYGLTLEHQPDFLGRSMSLSLAYLQDNQDEKASTFTLGFTYHFGTRVELKIRDRQYR
jgi:hypothetical protein